MSFFHRRYYLYTLFYLLAGGLVVLFTALLAINNYRDTVRERLDSYNQMLQILDTTYLQELVEQNERQLQGLITGLDNHQLDHGGQVKNESWRFLHLIKSEAHFIYYYHADTGRVEVYPGEISARFNATQRPWYALLGKPDERPYWIGPYTEYLTGKSVLTLGARVMGADGKIRGLMLVDMPTESIDRVLVRAQARLRSEQFGTLYLRQRNGPIISSVGPRLSPENNFTHAKTEPRAFGLLFDGVLLHRELSYVNWDLGIYLPPLTFRKLLLHELVLLLLPIGVLCLVAVLGIHSLLRLVRHEIYLVERKLSGLNNAEESSLRQREGAWFVDKSLTELETIRQNYQEHQLALRLDSLTCVYNRRAFDEDSARLASGQEHYALVLIDVDNFKQLNDTFGHQLGDLVLQRISDALVGELGLEQVYRIGGDEFAALMRTNNHDLPKLLDQLLARVRALRWRETSGVTLSIGVAIGPDAQLFQRADAALYRSKAAGRNTWRIDEKMGE